MTIDTRSRLPVHQPEAVEPQRAAPLIGTPAQANIPAESLRVAAERLDREIRAMVGRATRSLSVASALLAWGDWLVNLLISPGKHVQLQGYARDWLLAGAGPARRSIVPPALQSPAHEERGGSTSARPGYVARHRARPPGIVVACLARLAVRAPRRAGQAPCMGLPGKPLIGDALGRYVFEK